MINERKKFLTYYFDIIIRIVYNSFNMKQQVVLETSFWTVGYYAQINQYLFDYLNIYVTKEAKQEILQPSMQFPSVVYPYAKLFQLLLRNNQFTIKEPKERIKIFGKGDSSSISLALELKIGLLINDNRPYQYAKNLGIPVVSVPGFILFLYQKRVIRKNALLKKLDIIKPITTPGLLKSVQYQIENIKPWEKE